MKQMPHAEHSEHFGLVSQSPQKIAIKKKTIRIRCRVRFRVILILRPHKLAIKKKVTKTKKHRISLGVVLG